MSLIGDIYLFSCIACLILIFGTFVYEFCISEYKVKNEDITN